MKKIPKAITVTVRNGDDFRATRQGKRWDALGLTLDYEGARDISVRTNFPKTPDPPYKLTYKLDPKGAYRVYVPRKGSGVWTYVYGPPNVRLVVCFLPDEWHDLRVSRRVEKVKK